MKRLWTALALCALAACINFDNSRDDFCQKRPDVCFGDGGIVGGGGGGGAGGGGGEQDSGVNDAGLDAGEADGGDAGELDGGEVDGGFDGGELDAGPVVEGWSVALGGEFCINALNLAGLGQNRAGQVAVIGVANGTCDLTGDGTTQVFNSGTTFFTRFGADGGADLVHYNPGLVPRDVAVDSTGGVVIAGLTGGYASLSSDAGCVGGGGLPAGDSACFARYKSDGGLLWSRQITSGIFNGGATADPRHVAMSPDDFLAFGGNAHGNIGSPGCVSSAGSSFTGQWWLGEMGSDGGSCWLGLATCTGEVDDVVVEPATHDVFFLGKTVATSASTCTFLGTGSQLTANTTGANYLVARFSAAGVALWASEIPELPGGTGRAHLAYLPDNNGKLFLAAPFAGVALSATFDGGVTSSNGSKDLVVIQIHPTAGVVLRAAGYKQFGGIGDELLSDFKATPDGGLWLAGHTDSSDGVDFGGALLVPDAGAANLFLAQFDSALGCHYARFLDGVGSSTIGAMQASGSAPAVMGTLKGTLELGSGVMTELPPGHTGYVGQVTLP